MVGSIVVVGARTRGSLLHFVSDLKFAQMNVQRSLIRELILHGFDRRRNASEAAKNICCMRDEYAIDHLTIS